VYLLVCFKLFGEFSLKREQYYIADLALCVPSKAVQPLPYQTWWRWDDTFETDCVGKVQAIYQMVCILIIVSLASNVIHEYYLHSLWFILLCTIWLHWLYRSIYIKLCSICIILCLWIPSY